MDYRKRREEQQEEKENSFSPSSLLLFFPKEQFEDSGCKKSKKDRNGCIMTQTVCQREVLVEIEPVEKRKWGFDKLRRLKTLQIVWFHLDSRGC